MSGWLTVREAAMLEGCTGRSIRQRIARKGLETRKVYRAKSPVSGNLCCAVSVMDLSQDAQERYCTQLGKALLPMILHIADCMGYSEGGGLDE